MFDILGLGSREAGSSWVLRYQIGWCGERGRDENEDSLDREERDGPEAIAGHAAGREVFGDVEGGHCAEEKGYEGDEGGEPGVGHRGEAGG